MEIVLTDQEKEVVLEALTRLSLYKRGRQYEGGLFAFAVNQQLRAINHLFEKLNEPVSPPADRN